MTAMPSTSRTARRSKYGNVPVVIDGIRFASKVEGRRWCELKLLERAGEISNLERQKRFPLRANFIEITTYVADFAYLDCQTGRSVIEDAKGFETDAFKIKWKLAQAVLPLYDFRLITRKRGVPLRATAGRGERWAA